MDACPHCGAFAAFPKRNDKCLGGEGVGGGDGQSCMELTSHKLHLGR